MGKASSAALSELTAMLEKSSARVKVGCGKSLAERRGISTQELEAMYSVGCNFYTVGKYSEAENIFKSLVSLDSMSARYFRSLGAVYQAQRQFDAAVRAYGFSTMIETDNPMAFYNAAECLMAKGDKAAASDMLKLLEHFVKPNTTENRSYLAKGKTLAEKID